jgi:hypothetical protein
MIQLQVLASSGAGWEVSGAVGWAEKKGGRAVGRGKEDYVERSQGFDRAGVSGGVGEPRGTTTGLCPVVSKEPAKGLECGHPMVTLSSSSSGGSRPRGQASNSLLCPAHSGSGLLRARDLL